MKKFFKVYGYILLFMFIYLGTQLILLPSIQFGLMIKYFIENGIDNEGAITYATVNSVYTTIIPIIFSIGILALITYLRKEKQKETFIVKKIKIENYFIMTLLAIVLIFLVEYLVYQIQLSGLLGDRIDKYSDLAEEMMSGSNIFLLILAVGIITPIGEELLFRGIILKELGKVHKVITAVIIQALLFGLFHMIAIQMIYASLLGLFLGFVAIKTRSILAPILIHMVYNSLGVLIGREIISISFLNKIENNLQIIIPCGIIALIIVLYIWIDPFKRYYPTPL